MSFFSALGSGLGAIGRAATSIVRTPFLGTAVRAIPVVGTAVTAGSLAVDAYHAFGGSPTPPPRPPSGLPPLPFSPPGASGFAMGFNPSTGMSNAVRSAVPAGSTVPAIQAQHANEIQMYGGRGRNHGIAPAQAFQMLIQAGVTLGPNYFRQKVMAPPGFVIVRNPMDPGQVVAVPKAMAQRAGLWHPHAKPPISVRDWHALKHAKAAIKKLHKVQKAAGIVHHATSKRPAVAVAHKKRK